jgi:drug/metabolite transporter (DMT)-like permease
MLGLCLILSGVGALVIAQGAIDMTEAAGISLLLGASLLWSIYTVGLRRAAIDAVTCTMIVVYPSIAALGIAMKLGFLASNIASVGFAEIWPYIVIQGLGVGLGSTLTYAIAIKRLGATRCATLGALSPVLTALAAIPFLGEGLGVFTIVGVLLVTAGVLYPRSAKKE